MHGKAPAMTLGFWIMTVLATMLGKTGGDTVSLMWRGEAAASVNGYLVGTVIFGVALVGLVGRR